MIFARNIVPLPENQSWTSAIDMSPVVPLEKLVVLVGYRFGV